MQRIVRIDEQVARLAKPPLLASAPAMITREDCLVVSAGFEERALSVLHWALQNNIDQIRVLIIEYLPIVAENRVSQMRDLCVAENLKYTSVVYDRQDPSGFGELFCKEVESVQGRLLVDISAMSRLLIVQILVALGTRKARFSRCSVIYSEASHYPPEADVVEHAISKSLADPLYSIMLLSSGVFDITVIPELSSVSLDGQQTRLIAFPSFNTEQLMALRAELQPSRYSIIHGVPPNPENRWRTNAISRLNHTESIRGEEEFETSTLDYRETLDRLSQIYSIHGSTERILVAPTGSKMQSVAVGLFRSFVRDVQVVYPTPHEFTSPSAYTMGVKQIYHLDMDPFFLPNETSSTD